MCGINGIYNFNQKPVNRKKLEKMNSRMIHRGPDDEGYFVSGSFGMAMRRLAIIDIDGGKQPISNEDERYHVILNGEIYNYLELRRQLEAKGHIFKTRSDTEVIIHLFEEKGTNCVCDLNGMFAFALWDNSKKELFLFRDRLGIKPLYYSFNSYSFIFSSDLSVLSFTLEFKDIDLDAFLLYIGMSYVPHPKTIFKNIHKLEPGHFIRVTNKSSVKISKYWDIREFETFRFSKVEDYEEIILDLLKDSIRLQLRSDVPVGTFLSGGIDSSSVVALLSARIDSPIKTFSIGFEKGFNELPYAKLVSNKFGTNHLETMLRKEDVSQILPEVINFLDEPLSDNAVIPTLILSKFATENGIKVILNGTGGDEIFGGYHRYIPQKLSWRVIRKMPVRTQKILAHVFSFIDKNWSIRIAEPKLNFIFSISGINFFLISQLLRQKEDYKKIIDNLLILYDKYVQSNAKHIKLHHLMYFDLKSYLVDDILAVLDKMTMAVSLEGRVPLLDHRIVEMAFKIPDHIKFKNGRLKGLLKETMQEILPRQLFSLPKAGICGPTQWWVNTVIKKQIYQSLIEEPIPLYKEIFNLDAIKQILMCNEINPSYSETIFSLYMFNLWYWKHIEKQDIGKI